MTKPTEGPYKVNKYGSIGAGPLGTSPIIATVEPFYGSDVSYGDHAANARLLAASWEMREALDEALDMMDFPPGSIGDEFVRDARALLARIDGDTE